MIEYPLKGVENDILSSDKLCTNFHKANHSNINISYSQQSDDIPTLYSCPICLCIPFAFYQEPYIFYKCNCGEYYCSIDYFLTNFTSYPINEINFKNSSSNINMAFCSNCSKFININEHAREYYKHTYIILDNIFMKTNSGENYDQFRYKINKRKVDFNEFEFVNAPFYSSDDFNFNEKINYKEFMLKFLNFDIIKLIEDKCKEYNKKIKTKDKNDVINLNKKLYIFSNFLYYVFVKNYTNKNLCFQILFNLAIVCLQINNVKKDNLSFFGNLKQSLSVSDEYNIIKNIINQFNQKVNANKFNEIFYDKYTKRFVVNSKYGVLISVKNNIAIKAHRPLSNFKKVMYLPNLKRNVIIFKDSNGIVLCDIEDTKIIKKITFGENNGNITNISLIDNEYIIIFMDDKYLIYKIKQEGESLQFELINKKNTLKEYEHIYSFENNFIFKNKNDIAIYELNKKDFNLELLFNIPLNTEYNVEINMNNNKILIKYLRGGQNYIPNKYEIYDIKLQKKLNEVKRDKPYNDAFFLGERFILEIKNYSFELLDSDSLVTLHTLKK